jgi:prefoldin subunit 5
MNELSSFNNKIEYATQEISNLFENKESLKKIKKTINSTKNIFPKK